MPVQTSYPGVYIEELPSSNHSVTPAPTSVTVFVGYTNPFWVLPKGIAPPFDQAVPLLSPADYQANFGGFFNWPWLPDYVGQAVSQFYLNGGSTAFVVALKASTYTNPAASPPTVGTVNAAQAAVPTAADAILTFTAKQPVGFSGPPTVATPMSITFSNITMGVAPVDPTPVASDTADLTIVYGSVVETYRRVLISNLVSVVNNGSQLTTVAGTAPASYTELLAGAASPIYFTYAAGSEPPTGADGKAVGTVIDTTTDFPPVFQANASLDKVGVFNLMALPGITDSATLAQALSYCEQKRAFFIMDPPMNAVADELAELLPSAPTNATPIQNVFTGATPAPQSPNGALYFPYLATTDPVTGQPSSAPPSGFVAGIFAKEDNNRGVWKSPAGLETTLLGTNGLVPTGVMTDPQQGVLNPLGINCLRTFPSTGTVVFGARTLVGQPSNPAFNQWGYVAVRRMALFIEDSLYESLCWAVFEPNAQPLWDALTQEVQSFMLGLYRQGAFAGSTVDTAFKVQCDNTTTTADDINNGVVNIVVSFAPLKPAEFVVIQIAQLAGQAQS